MSGNKYRNPWKYTVTFSKKVFKVSTHGKIDKHFPKKIFKVDRKIKIIIKNDKLLGDIIKN